MKSFKSKNDATGYRITVKPENKDEIYTDTKKMVYLKLFKIKCYSMALK